MRALDPEVQTRFDATLMRKGVPSPAHVHYRKWLRYYLDFCQKYHHAPTESKNFAPFARKLKDKNQTENQREQAHSAVSIFYEMQESKTSENDTGLLKEKTANLSTKKSKTPTTGADWRPVYIIKVGAIGRGHQPTNGRL